MRALSNRPASDFALGYLAAGSATELASEVAGIIARGGQASVSVGTDQLNTLVAENQQLHAQNNALRADIAALERYADELEAWGKRMEARANAKSS